MKKLLELRKATALAGLSKKSLGIRIATSEHGWWFDGETNGLGGGSGEVADGYPIILFHGLD
jgi:hypothetical protein